MCIYTHTYYTHTHTILYSAYFKILSLRALLMLAKSNGIKWVTDYIEITNKSFDWSVAHLDCD